MATDAKAAIRKFKAKLIRRMWRFGDWISVNTLSDGTGGTYDSSSAAVPLGVSEHEVDELCNLGIIEAHQGGFGHWRITPVALLAFLETYGEVWDAAKREAAMATLRSEIERWPGRAALLAKYGSGEKIAAAFLGTLKRRDAAPTATSAATWKKEPVA